MNRAVIAVVCVLFLGVALSTEAQTDASRGNGYYRTQYVQLHNAYLKDSNDVYTSVRLAQFYADQGNPMSNLPLARMYLFKSERRYKEMLGSNRYDKELRKLINKGVTLKSLSGWNEEIKQKAINRLSTEELSVVEIDQYIATFSDDKQIVKLAGLQRVRAAYRLALRENTISGYIAFLKNYSGTNEAVNAEKHIALLVDSLLSNASSTTADSLVGMYEGNDAVRKAVEKNVSQVAYTEARSLNTVESYKAYVNKYPVSQYTMDALERIDSLLGDEYKKLRKASDYAQFAINNSESALAEKAIDEVYRKVMEESDVQAARLFMKHFSLDSRYIDVYRRYYEWHSQEGCYKLIEYFQQHNPDYPFPKTVANDLNEAADIEALNLEVPYMEEQQWRYGELIKTFPAKRITYVALQRIIQNQVDNKEWDEAVARCEKYRSQVGAYNKVSSDTLLELLRRPWDSSREPLEIRLDEDDVVSFVVEPSGKKAYYTKRYQSGTTEICSATKDGGRWVSNGTLQIEGLDGSKKSVYSIFDGGRKMLVGANGDIMIAQAYGDKWRVSEIPSYPVNTDYIETDAQMIPDGSGILLASDRPDGYNIQWSGMHYHGDSAVASDIYFIPRTTTGWGEAVNLGHKVNTCYSERFPVMSMDMKTLYFVSDCGGGLGYGDVYVVKRKNADSWQEWSSPINIGKEVNTAFHEGGLSMSNDGTKLYVCRSGRTGKSKGYEVTINTQKADGFSEVEFAESNSEGSFVDCAMYELPNGNEVHVDIVGNRRRAIVKNGESYLVVVYQKDRWMPLFDIIGGKSSRIDVKGEKASGLEGKTYPLNYVTVGQDDESISAIGKLELGQLSKFLLRATHLAIDIVVDVPGSDAARCHNISVKQGNAMREYMVTEGVAADRISVVGHGNLGNKTSSGKPSIYVKFKKH